MVLIIIASCTSGIARADDCGSGGFIPTPATVKTGSFLTYAISWLEDDQADAHRIYPLTGNVKTITIGDGYGFYGERKFSLGRDGRVTGRASNKTEYSVEDRRRHNVTMSTVYTFDETNGTAEARVHCNGRFFERHVYEIDTETTSVRRYSYHPDGSRESAPTMTLDYDNRSRTLQKTKAYLFHDGICEPNWSVSPTIEPTITTFVFDQAGFVAEVISGDDQDDKMYKHWRFIPDERNQLRDTILLPDTHQFRSDVKEYDSFGNPLLTHRSYAKESFGTVDFEYYDEEKRRLEYYEGELDR